MLVLQLVGQAAVEGAQSVCEAIATALKDVAPDRAGEAARTIARFGD